MSVEHNLLTYVLTEGDMLGLVDANVREEYFHDERARRAFVWLRDRWMRHREVPSEEAFARQFPSYHFQPWPGDPLPFMVEELRNRHALRKYADEIPPMIDQLGMGIDGVDPSVVTTGLRQLLSEVEEITTPADTLDISKAIELHLEKVLNRKDNPVTGITTGFPSLDSASGGLHPEQLIILGGSPKAGKSSLWLQSAIAAAVSGAKVACVTFEMSNSEQMDRELAFVSGVATDAIQRGHFTEADRIKLDRGYDIIRKLNMVFIHDVSSATTISGLTAAVRKHRPDALFVDGVYHMVDETAQRGDNETVKLTRVSRGLKRLAASEKIPLFATTQSLLSKQTKRGGVQMETLGWTGAWAQDSDVILGLDRPDLKRPEALLKVVAARNMQGMEIPILVDHTRGVIAETSRGVGFTLNYGGDDDDDD